VTRASAGQKQGHFELFSLRGDDGIPIAKGSIA